MVRFDKETYLSLLFKFILFERINVSLCGSEVLLFSEFMNIASILYCIYHGFSMYLYIFLVISFAQYKEYVIFQTSFSKFLDILPAFTCASAIGNL